MLTLMVAFFAIFATLGVAGAVQERRARKALGLKEPSRVTPAAQRVFDTAALPRTDIAGLADGQRCRVVGFVRELRVEAFVPTSGRRCAAWAVEVLHRGGRQEFTGGCDFIVEDASGRALVRMSGALPAPVLALRYPIGRFGRPWGALTGFLERHGLPRRRVLLLAGACWDGSFVAVSGVARREPDPEAPPTAGYRDDVPRRLVITSEDGVPVVVTDSPIALK